MPTLTELFHQQRHRRFGTSNPEKMELEYWKWAAQNKIGPYKAIKRFNADLDQQKGPDWCFPRDFMSSTKLLDGRTIHIGGEYEDSYDPEFCIYNDVVVIDAEGGIEIFGYPRDVFPPTDLHTATLVEDRIILIGSFGYPEDRMPGSTSVFALDAKSYKIDALETTGVNPGWIFKHSADFNSKRDVIAVTGGEIVVRANVDEQRLLRNVEEYELDVRSLKWCRTTQRNWRQFRIVFFDNDGRRTYPEPDFKPESCLPKTWSYKLLDDDLPWKGWPIRVNGVPITFRNEFFEIQIIVESDTVIEEVSTALDETMKRTQAHIHADCRLEALN